MQRHAKLRASVAASTDALFSFKGFTRMRKQRRLTDGERETIQLLRKFGPLNISQTARAMRCSRATVRYWQVMRAGKNQYVFVRPKGIFIGFAGDDDASSQD